MLTVDESQLPLYHQKAREWIRENPRAWAYICKSAKKREVANKPFGMKYLMEHVRWVVETEWNEEYKVNNNYTAYLADELCARYPELRKFIRKRDRKHERAHPRLKLDAY